MEKMTKKSLKKKITFLADILESYNSLAVALSGGVDSSFLLLIAKKILKNRLLAITAKSVIHFDRDLEDAKNIAKKLEIEHLFFESDEMVMDEFISNGERRCFFCKKGMLQKITLIAKKNGFLNIAHGSNCDDLNDYRPGNQAAEQMKILNPLVEANFYKKDVRYAAKFYGLNFWAKPSTACAATRFPYGTKIDIDGLRRVKEAESALFDMGFELCRVRHYGHAARIEVDPKLINLFLSPLIREKVLSIFKKIGYGYVAIDLEGYKLGNMNKFLSND